MMMSVFFVIAFNSLTSNAGFSGVPEYNWTSDKFNEKTGRPDYITKAEVEKSLADCKADIESQQNILKDHGIVVLAVRSCTMREVKVNNYGVPETIGYSVNGSFQFIR